MSLNRASGLALIALSCIAFLTVLSGYIFRVPSQTDEGTQAHIFELAVLAAAATVVIFIASADWKKPLSSARPLLAGGIILFFAFFGLYLLEHQ